MNFHASEITDQDDVDFSATYGSAVFVLEAEKPRIAVFGKDVVPRIGYLPELERYLVRPPKAA